MKRTLITRSLVGALVLCAASAFAQDPIVSGQALLSLDNTCITGNETSAAATLNGADIIAGFNDYRNSGNAIFAGFGVSSDGGATWEHVKVRPPAQNQSSVEGDPMACYDARTNTLWAGAMSFAGNGGIYVAKKNLGSNTFQASVMARTNGSVDKGWMAAGPLPGQPNTTRLYITYNQGVIWSDDLGATFTNPKSLGGGLGFLPRVGPNGELYVTTWDTGTGIIFKRSLDGGNNWFTKTAATRMDTWGTEFSNTRVPGTYRIPPIHTMAVNPIDGSIVIVYFDTTNIISGNKNLDLYLVRSTDQGTTWTTPARLPFRPMNTIGDMFFPWVEYSRDGRLHLHSFDSSYTTQNDGIQHGMLDNVYAYSDDNGATWSPKFRLTPNSYDSQNNGLSQFWGVSFLGDYSGIAVTDRRVYATYPDCHTNQAEIYTNAIFDPIVIPDSMQIIRGTLLSGAVTSLYLHDPNWIRVQAGLIANASESPAWIETKSTAPSASPSSLKTHLWAFASTPNLLQTVQLFNVNTHVWDTIDSRAGTTSESNTVVTVGTPTDYIASGSRLVRMRVGFRPIGPVNASNWVATVNQNVLLVGP